MHVGWMNLKNQTNIGNNATLRQVLTEVWHDFDLLLLLATSFKFKKKKKTTLWDQTKIFKSCTEFKMCLWIKCINYISMFSYYAMHKTNTEWEFMYVCPSN
jgi:hypothetical protein